MENKGGSTLCSVLSVRGLLSTAGSVSVTPFPPSTSTSSLHPPPPFSLLAADPVIRPGLTSGGPLVLVLGGPETEADSAGRAASTQAVGTAGPAHLDPLAPHVHQQNTRSAGRPQSLH